MLKLIIKLFITIGILFYLFLKIPATDVITAMLDIKIAYLLAAFFLQMVMRYINAVQLRIFTRQQKMDFTVFQLVKINLVAQFYGLILPGELSASVIKWHKLSMHNNMRAQALACMVLSRTISTICLAILGIIFFFIEMPYDSVYIGISLFIGLAISVVAYLSFTNIGLFCRIGNLITKIGAFRVTKHIGGKIGKIWNSIRSFHDLSPGVINYTIFISFLFHVVDILLVYLLVKGLGINISIVSIIWIRAAVLFLQMLPISISGLGVREGTFVFLLGNYGVLAPDAMALSLLFFGILVVFALLGGVFEAIEFLKQKQSKTGV